MRRSRGTSNDELTTRLQKGGALLSDMRVMVAAWSEDLDKDDPLPALARVLPKATLARVQDTYVEAFRPRFLQGSPPSAWRMARVLEDLGADLEVIRPFYYWITARAEAPLRGFAVEVLYSKFRSGDPEVRVEEAVSWLERRLAVEGKAWTPTVTLRVAQGIMAALRGFGILEGRVRKRITPVGLPANAFALIAFCLHAMGATGGELVRCRDWRLFLLGEAEVERLFLECHNHRWLCFELAGSLFRTEFPDVSFEEYARAVLG